MDPKRLFAATSAAMASRSRCDFPKRLRMLVTKMIALVACHATFVAAFVWLFG